MLVRLPGYGRYVPTVDELSDRPKHLHGVVVPVDNVLAGVLREIHVRTAPVVVTYEPFRRRR